MPANGAVGGAAYNQKKHELLLELLEELKEEQVAIGHVGGDGMSLADVRWDLERVAMGQQSSVLLLAAADEAALEAALQAAPGWRSVDGGWQIEDEASGDRIQTKRLQERREAAAAPVLGTRKLGALTHLLRDPAYELATLPSRSTTSMLARSARAFVRARRRAQSTSSARSCRGRTRLSPRFAKSFAGSKGFRPGRCLVCESVRFYEETQENLST